MFYYTRIYLYIYIYIYIYIIYNEEMLSISQENKYLRLIKGKFLFYHENACCLYSLESPQLGDSNDFNQHTIIL